MLSVMTRTFNYLGEDTGPKRALWSTFLSPGHPNLFIVHLFISLLMHKELLHT